MSSVNLFVCWTIDWQDNYLWESDNFISVSRALHAHTLDLLAGKVTWFAEVDNLTDITRFPGISQLIPEILTYGGEVGIHVHHTSICQEMRSRDYQRAIDRIKCIGGNPITYSAGMGNYIDADTDLLVKEGICTQRSYSGDYVNGELPPLEWFPPNIREQIFSLFPEATHRRMKDPVQNPVACDWRGSLDRAGYINPENYRHLLDNGQMFVVPLGIMDGNEDGEQQLHIKLRISLERLKAIFDAYRSRAENDAIFVSCYFHPYDMTECGAEITQEMLDRWRRFVEYQNESGSRFLTLTEAREVFECLKTESDRKDKRPGG